VTFVLSTRNVQLCYGKSVVLKDVTLDVRAGEFTVFVGPNGAGKSTLLRILAGVLQPTAGSVQMPASCARIAYLAQTSRLPRDWTACELVNLGRLPHHGIWKTPGPHDGRAVAFAMAETETLGFADQLLSNLSGGEQQRVALARALAQEPQALLLDEPTNHLDFKHQMDILRILRSQAAQGVAVVAVIHDLGLAALADRCVILSAGEMVACGPPNEVLRPELLLSVFGAPVEVLRMPNGRVVVIPSIAPLAFRASDVTNS